MSASPSGHSNPGWLSIRAVKQLAHTNANVDVPTARASTAESLRVHLPKQTPARARDLRLMRLDLDACQSGR